MMWKASRRCDARDKFATILRVHFKANKHEYCLEVPAKEWRDGSYAVPTSRHFVCPHCGAYWLEFDVLDSGSYHQAEQQNCPAHGGTLYTNSDFPFELLPQDIQEEHFLTYLKEESCLV